MGIVRRAIVLGSNCLGAIVQWVVVLFPQVGQPVKVAKSLLELVLVFVQMLIK